jgi:hypothetical protein
LGGRRLLVQAERDARRRLLAEDLANFPSESLLTRTLQQLVKEPKPYIVGWRGYFGLCQTPRALTNLEEWVRQRLRLYLWRTMANQAKPPSRSYAAAA